MTLYAIKLGMRAYQGKSGNPQVIECREPVVRAVACLAFGRKTCRLVIRISRGTKIAGMAGSAIRAESQVHACRSVFMAAFTLDCRVGAPKRESVFMPIRLLFDAKPSKHVVAAFTIASHQTSVNVRMAVAALSADFRENHIGVALRTSQILVQPLNRVACGGMAEFRR